MINGPFQTRSHKEDIKQFTFLKECFEEAKKDPEVWKISFNAPDGNRIRLIRTEEGWLYEDVMGNREV